MEIEKSSRGAPSLWARASGSPLFSFAVRALGVIVVIGVLAGVGRGASGSVAAGPEVLASSAPPASSASSGPAPPPPDPPPAPAPAPIVAAAAPTRATADAPVYLNQADRAELRRLPGVGPKRADAILALRERLGRFHRLEDLLRVKGIGRATLKRWRPLVRLEPAPDAGPPS